MSHSFRFCLAAILCVCAVARPTAAQPPAPSTPEIRFHVGFGLSSFKTEGGTPWEAPRLRRDRYDLALLVHRVGGYLAYSTGLQDPDRSPTRWVQRDLELGALWTAAEARTGRTRLGLTLGLGGIHSWMHSGPSKNYVPVLLFFGSGGNANHCTEPTGGAPNDCSIGPTFDGNAWGFTPSVLGTIGRLHGAFLGLRLAGRYLWVNGADTPSFVREQEALIVLGSALPVSFGTSTP